MTPPNASATQRLPVFETQIAQGPDDLRAAQRLRYQVFVAELGGDGPQVDHAAQIEQDEFDAAADHILLCDRTRAEGDQLIGIYRVMTAKMAHTVGRFYCAGEYDLAPLLDSGKQVLELGRSCLHPDYRGGPAMMHLWSALADYVKARQIDVMFGVASFHGTDVQALAGPLSLLHHRHLVREELRVKATGPTAFSLNMMPEDAIDRVAAVRQIPALIKAYLRLGGTVGEGGFVDHAFNTVDVCLILESAAVRGQQKTFVTKGRTRD